MECTNKVHYSFLGVVFFKKTSYLYLYVGVYLYEFMHNVYIQVPIQGRGHWFF